MNPNFGLHGEPTLNDIREENLPPIADLVKEHNKMLREMRGLPRVAPASPPRSPGEPFNFARAAQSYRRNLERSRRSWREKSQQKGRRV